MAKRKIIVTADWLYEQQSDSQVIIIDCRFELTSPDLGRKQYEEGHIPQAQYFDLESDLSGPVNKHGGRHPLPDLKTFTEKLSRAGIDEHVTVVAYDDQKGMMASRFWWLLTYLGHSSVYILDGGFSKWKEKRYPITKEVPKVVARLFTPNINDDMLVDIENVRESLHKTGTVLVDARNSDRYLGIEEPLDPKAGHIPGAVNMFWGENVNDNGEWRTVQSLKKRFSALKNMEEIIVYCGSGVSACPNILAMKEAGINDVKLYIGSWSDWCSYPENPIETKMNVIE